MDGIIIQKSLCDVLALKDRSLVVGIGDLE